MTSKQDFRGITKHTLHLLENGEDKHVDYKQNIKGIHAEDLVAFANSDEGGVLLIGVKEEKDESGRQIGVPCGCLVGDKARLQIMGKALSCSPPVQVEIFVENLSKIPFYRIEIPAGSQKPYSTNSGTYKKREDGRNNPMHPEQLLSMFLEREGEEFRQRFSQATGELEGKMHHALNVVGNLEDAVTSKIEDISSSMGWADKESGRAKNRIEDVDNTVNEIQQMIKRQQDMIEVLYSQYEMEDLLLEKAKNELLEVIIKQLEKNKIFNEKALGDKNITEISKKIITRLLTDAIMSIQSKKEEY